MISKISNIFIWWSGQTIGTYLYTKFFGILVGTDELGNNYFTSSDGKKRWVNYIGDCDASSISPNWHSWIHKTTNNLPEIKESLKIKKKDNIYSNTTGSSKAYHPNNCKNDSKYNDYIPWKPKN